MTPLSASIKVRRKGQDVDISILSVGCKSLERNMSLDARLRSGYTRSRYRPPRTHISLFVRLKIDPDHLTHFFETRVSWYLILRPQSSVNGVAGGYIRAGNGGLVHSPALVFTRLKAAQKVSGQSASTAPRTDTHATPGGNPSGPRKSPWTITVDGGNEPKHTRDRRTIQSVRQECILRTAADG